MDIKILRNFVEIVDSGSLTAASKKLFIAQPALSNQLKALEKELNTTLIERNSRHQRLTDAGKLFYDRAKSIILMENAMIGEIHDVCEGKVGCLRIATIQSAEINLLQEIIPTFAKQFPLVTYEITEKESEEIVRLLQDGETEIGVMSSPFPVCPDMDIYHISDENLVCAYDPEVFSFDTNQTEISLHDLKDKPLLIIHRYENMFLSLCQKELFCPNIRARNKQLTLNLKWAEAGLGIAIVPENSLSYCQKNLAFKTIAEKGLTTKRAIITMKNSFHSKAMKNFLALCKEKL
ncbi:MAG: LysR family transcriptional regulator [Clostridia bacterium]|nr:LysR family transcriptional regulator [Clostridia bacterium]